MDKLFDKILEISREKEGKTLVEMTLKCTEELGELSEAVLSYTNTHGCGYKNLGREHVLEELTDVIIVIVALAAKAGISKDEIKGEMEKKLLKWVDKITKNDGNSSI